MINVLLFGKNSDSIRHFIPQYDLVIVDDKPDVIISYGGDGTLLSAERKYPGIAKLPIRDSKVCKKCPLHETEHLLKKLSEGKLNLEIFPKLEAKFAGEDVLALNDIVVRNSVPIHALRFRVYISGKLISPELIIGDGVVITTTYGSSGYYESITREEIEEGFALAFNNTTQSIKPIKFTENDEVKISIVRGPGTLSADNNPKYFILKQGDEVKIFSSSQHAKIYVEKTLRCSDCVILRDKRLR